MPRYRQEVINIRVADILREMGFGATGEIICGGKLPDVMVEINGVTLNIEGDFKKSKQANALREKCRERVEDRICNIAIGLIYPDELREAENDTDHIRKIKRSTYQVFILSPSLKGITEKELGEMSLEDLADTLNYLYAEIIDTDLLEEQIKRINKAIQECARMSSVSSLFFSSEKVMKKLTEALGIGGKIKTKQRTFREELTKIALFIIFDGLLFHQTVSSHEISVNGLEQVPKSNILGFIRKEWHKIMEKNYLPIFTIAQEVVNCLPTSPKTDRIFNIFIPEVLETISSGVLLKHDLMGRVYHKLLLKSTGKYYAAYYTSIPAAWILSDLAIKTNNPDLDWKFDKVREMKNLNIIDPACGSGTLLSGIYMSLKNKYVRERYIKNSEELNLSAFHKFMMENILNGWDVQDYAGHLTLITLAFHNPNTFFTRSKIRILPAGEKNKKIYLGSLSFLVPQLSLPIKGFVVHPKEKGIKEDREVPLNVKPHSMDVVIMNPPFSRSCRPNIKFGYEKKAVRKKMNRHLGELGRRLGYKRIGQAGLGAYFIILANNLLKLGGRLALVIPRSFLSGVSWREIRETILKEYEIEYVVSNYDPGCRNLGIEPWNWSENTNLGEVLVVARKTNKPIKKRYVTFVNLWNKPKNEIESLVVTSNSTKTRENPKLNLLKGEQYDTIKLNKEMGVVYNLPQEYLINSFLPPCLFANPHLNKLTLEFINNPPFRLVPLSSLVQSGSQSLGRDIKQIKTNFKKTDIETPYRILWGHTSSFNTLEIKSQQLGYGRPKKEKVDIYDSVASFLIATRPHLKTENLVAMYSPEKVLATAFWEVQIEKEKAKILTLWLNSTFGLLLYLSNAVNSMGEIFKFKKTQLKDLPVIDINVLDSSQIEKLLSLYETLKSNAFHSFPQEFSLASQNKGLRKRIDDEFIDTLKIDIDLKPYYKIFSKEPIMTLERL